MDITKLTTRHGLGSFLTANGLNGRGVEVGSLNGAHARLIMSSWPHGKRLYLVDPWGQHDPKIYREDTSGNQWATYLRECEQLAEEYENRVTLLRMRSLDAVGRFDDNSLSFAYIDGDHGFHAVIADAVAWWPKVRSGGIFGFHDATYNDTVFPRYAEVKRALESWNEFMRLPVHFTPQCTSAWFVKP